MIKPLATTRTGSQIVIIPDFLANWPWSCNLSEHYPEVKAESNAWIDSFKPFTPEFFKRFIKWDFCLLASLVYSQRGKPVVRLACDLMNIFFLYDEYSDLEDRSGARKLQDITRDVYENPDKPRPEGESCVGVVVKDFYHNFRGYVGPDALCLERFIRAWDMYTPCVTQEAEDRVSRKYRTFDDYLRIRRHTIGLSPPLALVEAGLDIPEEVHRHPILQSLRNGATDLVIISNDFCSYAVEKARGSVWHNGVEVVMREQGITLQESFDWLGRYAEATAKRFMEDVGCLPSWGPRIDEHVHIYVDGVGQWVRGNDDWSFMTSRYLGTKGQEIKRSRVLDLSSVFPTSLGSADMGSAV